ncbi:hypothetical protein L2D08_05805 [Domibacillus sp. PGB-M46]|uniref:hypothetical protein n=1 Tax=Domibacillus sp. PGB-M46 TaxID=2910255 RepID=UPI001F599AE0|nr:hypothetical protein [Domibacillus sp. PGB-M46]MCI2253876.1 hypothetical protein [Domibacillus sp. PGB-M46]
MNRVSRKLAASSAFALTVASITVAIPSNSYAAISIEKVAVSSNGTVYNMSLVDYATQLYYGKSSIVKSGALVSISSGGKFVSLVDYATNLYKYKNDSDPSTKAFQNSTALSSSVVSQYQEVTGFNSDYTPILSNPGDESVPLEVISIE